MEAVDTKVRESSIDSVDFKELLDRSSSLGIESCPSLKEKGENCSFRDDGLEENLSSPKIIGRQVLRSDGVFVEGQVQGTFVNFTVDTGAARTVLSKRAFHRIPKSHQPDLKISNALASADGKPLEELGKAIFDVKLGDLSFEMELIVANIEDEALLGLDILMKADWGPADLRLSTGVILLGGKTIHCTQIGQPEKIRKIRVADDYQIPPRSEILIDVFIDRFEKDASSTSQTFVLESTDDVLEKYPILMAPTVVNIEKDVTSLVRVMNPFDQEFLLHQDTVLGEAEKLIEYEDKEEINNFSQVRRIKLCKNKPVNWETNVGLIRNLSKKGTNDGGKSGVVPDHLKDMYTEVSQDCSPEEQQVIAKLLCKFSDTFSKNETDLGLTTLVEHSIDTGDAKPVKQPPRRVPMAFASEEKKLIDKMQDQGIIQKSNSPWASPLVLVMKKSGKLRPCVDYRNVNSLTKKDAFPLPRIQDCLDTIAGSTLFSVFDLISSFHQIPVKVQDIPKTAFVTKYGMYEYKTLPMGLWNGPATCQRLMELVLNGLQWQICLIYLDDIIVFGSNFEEHISRLDTVLQRISEAGLC